MHIAKRFLFFVALIGISHSCIAQLESYIDEQGKVTLEEWGKVTKEELMMTQCSFEKNADAMLLLDLAQVLYHTGETSNYYTTGFRITTNYYQRYKVFSENGTSHANKVLTVRTSWNEEVRNLRAICTNLVNGEVKKTILNMHDVHTTKLSEHENQVSFTVPGVMAGSVFEVIYQKEQDVTYTLPDWYFTSSVPSVRSSLTVGFRDRIGYYIDKHVVSDTIEEEREKMGTLTAVTYTMRNLKSYAQEPYTTSPKNYMNWIRFQLKSFATSSYISDKDKQDTRIISSFDKLSEHIFKDPLFVANVVKNPIPNRQWDEIISKNMSKETKTWAIYDYIRRNIKWNGAEGLIPVATNADIWKNKTGSWADISVLLICALRSEGITAYPIIVGSRHNPDMNQSYPILDDYSGLDVLVIMDGDRKLLLDPTERYLRFGEADIDQLNTSGLVLQDIGKYYWYAIEDKKESEEKVFIKTSFDESGKMSGAMTLAFGNHSGDKMVKAKKNDNREAISEYLKREIPNVTVEDMSDSIDALTSSFIYSVKFSAQAVTDNDGNVYISMSSVYGDLSSPFVNKQRMADIDLGYRCKTTVSMEIQLPDGYAADPVPAPLSVSMKDSAALFANHAEIKNKTVVLYQDMDYRKSFFKVADYPAFFDFEKKYYDIKQRPVVIRKKI